MSSIVNYVFKPKHGTQLARKIIGSFVNKYLLYEEHGFYLYWREKRHVDPLPEGYVEFTIESDDGNMEYFTETCFGQGDITSGNLTDDFFAMLDDSFWEKDSDGNIYYSFEDRELMEVVMALAADGSRVVSTDAHTASWVGHQEANGEWKVDRIDTTSHLLNVPLEAVEKEKILQKKQMNLPHLGL